jgi:uncharacterized protein (TIGR02217 family)
VDVEKGAEGGPQFKTRILELDSGDEQRNIQWQRTRGAWDISYGISSKSLLNAVIAFFYARWGRAYGFRFKDWADFQIGNTFTDDPATKQSIGVGDAGNFLFQIYKQYDSGGFNFQRKITRPVSGSLLVWVGGVLKTETTDYTVNYGTGLITFVIAPGDDVDVSVICEFDVPVRFDVDKLDITSQTYDAIQIGSISILELKE